MKYNFTKLGTLAVALAAANLCAQDNYKNLNPGGVVTLTNTNGFARGIIIRGATNSAGTNGLGQGAPGRNKGLDSGEGKGSASGVRPVPGVGSAPSVGNAPSVGAAPS